MSFRNLTRTLGRSEVHILVGEAQHDFAVHRDLICNFSPYFKAAFTSAKYEEAKTGVMKLPKTSVEIFDLFYGWLYSQILWDNSFETEDWPKTNDLMKLYVFADMAKIPSLKNQCIDTISEISDLEELFPIESIAYVYENTLKGSLLRRFIVDSLVWEQDPDTFYEIAEHLTAEFRLEAMVAMRNVIYTHSTSAKPNKMINPLENMKNYHEDKTKVEVKTRVNAEVRKKAPVKVPFKTFPSPPTKLHSALPTKLPTAPTDSTILSADSPITASPRPTIAASPRPIITASPSSPIIAPGDFSWVALAVQLNQRAAGLPISPPFEPISPVRKATSEISIKLADVMEVAEVKIEAKPEFKEVVGMEGKKRVQNEVEETERTVINEGVDMEDKERTQIEIEEKSQFVVNEEVIERVKESAQIEIIETIIVEVE